MNRRSRSQSAQAWLKEYDGKKENMARNYRKRYGVGWECAFKEFEFLGVKLDSLYVNTVLQNLKNQNATKKRRVAKDLEDFCVEPFRQIDDSEDS